MPKIIGATITEHREKTRQALFDALSSLLKEQSYETITMSQISRRAGVGRTAIYNHFEDKDSMLLGLMSAATEDFTRVLLEALQIVDDPIQRIRIYIRAQLELRQQYHLADGMNFRQLTSNSPSDLRQHARIIHHSVHHLLNEAYKTGRITQEPSVLLINMIHASLAGQSIPANHQQRNEVMADIEAFILRGLGASDEDIAWVDPRVDYLDFTFGNQNEIPPHELEDEVSEANFLRCPVSFAH